MWPELSTFKAGYLNPAIVKNRILNLHNVMQISQKLCENLFDDILRTQGQSYP